MKTIAAVCLATVMMFGMAFGQSSTGQTPKEPPKKQPKKNKAAKKEGEGTTPTPPKKSQ